MRKLGGLLLAVAMLVPIGLAASPAGAAGGTVCKAGSGSATFSPALPPIGSTVKVKDVTTATGSLTGCSGTVKSGTFKFVSTKSTGSNCTTIATYTKTASGLISGKLTVTWNTKATSTIALTLNDVPKNPLANAPTGKVTAGLFVGSKLSTSFVYKLVGTGACSKAPLAKVTLTIKATTIK